MVSVSLQAKARACRIWYFGTAEFDELRWELRVAGRLVALEPRPLQILACLLRRAGETVTKETLLHEVWGHSHLTENALSNAIGKLRKALDDEAQQIIVTVHRVGYRLAATVESRALPSTLAELGLDPGDEVPGRPGWRLVHRYCSGDDWLAEGPDEQRRLFRFSVDGARLPLLRHEAEVSRMLVATLDRPDQIATLIDARLDRLPYFLEFELPGECLADWAARPDHLPATTRAQRVELLATMADAVSALHTVGVLHRALNPSNLWIRDNGSGGFAIRLAGFGLDSTPPEADTPSAATNAPASMYWAPELRRAHIATVQSDLYALGVLLYQLLLGDLQHPMAAGWEREIDDELLREDIDGAASGRPERRLASVRDFAERLRSLKQRRQQRAEHEQQARDAQRANEALARARSRRPWIATSMLALATGLVISLWFYREASRARNEALADLEIAQAAKDFLDEDLIASADPDIGGSVDVTMLEAVRRAAARIDRRFANQPEVAISLHQTVGSAYRTLGRYAAAEHEYRAAQGIAARVPALRRDPYLGSSLRLAQVLAAENKYAEAAGLLREVDALTDRGGIDDPLLMIRRWDVHAQLDRHRGDLVAAQRDSARALAALEDFQRHRPDDGRLHSRFVLATRRHISLDLQDSGEHELAERMERALLDDLQKSGNGDSGFVLRVRQQLVSNLTGAGRYAEAQQLIDSLMLDAHRLFGEDTPVYLNLLEARAAIAAGSNRLPDAVTDARAAEAGYLRLLGLQNDVTIRAMLQLGTLLVEARKHDAAVEQLHRAERAADQLQGGAGPLTQLVRYALAAVDPASGGNYSLPGTLHIKTLSAAAPENDWSQRLANLRRQEAERPCIDCAPATQDLRKLHLPVPEG